MFGWLKRASESRRRRDVEQVERDARLLERWTGKVLLLNDKGEPVSVKRTFSAMQAGVMSNREPVLAETLARWFVETKMKDGIWIDGVFIPGHRTLGGSVKKEE
jgi:hypothetical protein